MKEIYKNFEENLKMTDRITNVGSIVGEITLGLLKSLEKENSNLQGFMSYKEKLVRVKEQVEKIKDHPQLKNEYAIIYNQAIVLVVSYFESFMTDLFKELINNHQVAIQWPEKKIIPVDLNIFKYSAFPTVGDLIVNNLKDISFQDLQSTMRFLEEYLSINNLPKDEDRDDIILFQAVRHVIIHNSSKVDASFLKQLRDTRYKSKFNEGDNLELKLNDYNKAKEVFTSFANGIIADINKHYAGLTANI